MDRRLALELSETGRAELFALLGELIAAPSPFGSSAMEAQTRLGDYLDRNGFAVRTSEDSPEASHHHPEFSPLPAAGEKPVNLIAAAPGGEPSGCTFFAHVDTESPEEGWSTPPNEAVLREGRVHGLGAADDKGGLAAAAVAAALLLRHHGAAPRVASVHGKGGGARGTLPVFRRIEEPGDCLYIHPPENGAGLGVLKTRSRGVLDVTLRVRGWSGRPREIGTPESAPFDEGGDALDACLRLVEALRRGELADCELNLGRVAAGESAGRTPVGCVGELRVLFEEPRTALDLLSTIRRTARAHASLRSAPNRVFRFEIAASGLRANPASTPWNDPLCSAAGRAVTEITGRRAREYAGHLASDIRFPIRLRGAPSLGIGALGGNFYGPDEWVDLDDLVRLVAVLTLVGSRRDSTT